MKVAIILLVVLLLGSNAFWISYWLYHGIDAGVTLAHRDQQIEMLEETRKQLMATVPEVAKNLGKEEILAIAKKYSDQEAFEKEGCTWVGWIGFKFSKNGKLESLSPSWSFGNEDPCYSAF